MAEHGGNTLEVALQLGIAPDALLDFSANINPLGMPDSLQQAIVAHLRCAERYPDVEYRQLHAALATAHGCPADAVVAGNGATELIYALVQYLKPRKALLLTPGFAEYRRALLREGCQIDTFALQEALDWQPDVRLLAAVADHHYDCVFITTPNNPTGLMPDQDLLLALVAVCQQRDTTLIVDESFLDFLPQDTGLLPQLARHSCLFILRSLTKFFAIPGLRLGYLLSSNNAVLQALRERREPWSINAYAALAGEVILQDSAYIAATHRWLAQEQPRLLAALDQLPGLRVWPPRANYLFLRCLQPDLNLQQALLAHRILIRRCANFPGLGPDYYRVAIKSASDNQRLIAALTQVLGHG